MVWMLSCTHGFQIYQFKSMSHWSLKHFFSHLSVTRHTCLHFQITSVDTFCLNGDGDDFLNLNTVNEIKYIATIFNNKC